MTALRSLANQLGISVSTASRALNGCTDVSPATRARVQAAADALGYRPHPAAHRLANRLAGRMVHSELSGADGESAAAAILADGAEVTAILCVNDALALGAIAACKRAGRKVGKCGGVSIVGYGNTEPGRYADPALTTLDYSIEDNGRDLGRVVLQLLAGIPAAELRHLEPVRLVVRESTSIP